ncbi:uncharacterized protein L969DRAFT_300751 [Mixia osmundae IAM 14324]|uniref:Transcription regulator Rua1 C-terminal domain-containing protein n=1 Tax=Mixia osmundae (strain CBS 9802 / IAM 14324 / JCM 22182 / KY 12970) TaxID=764103 RepID=G7DXW8_MIXOS|nr:uncharacterized protein L969DRAFT_300751 [Mixia osmundae IAM 14324]KEI41331.1 hypothetical protein L969DRAFT_300751 [Mixia osmundae IAM 14324]GAA95428.1 hypothetical protein E5Q_02082 [Mixia osmundae IAM 14324]
MMSHRETIYGVEQYRSPDVSDSMLAHGFQTERLRSLKAVSPLQHAQGRTTAHGHSPPQPAPHHHGHDLRSSPQYLVHVLIERPEMYDGMRQDQRPSASQLSSAAAMARQHQTTAREFLMESVPADGDDAMSIDAEPFEHHGAPFETVPTISTSNYLSSLSMQDAHQCDPHDNLHEAALPHYGLRPLPNRISMSHHASVSSHGMPESRPQLRQSLSDSDHAYIQHDQQGHPYFPGAMTAAGKFASEWYMPMPSSSSGTQGQTTPLPSATYSSMSIRDEDDSMSSAPQSTDYLLHGQALHRLQPTASFDVSGSAERYSGNGPLAHDSSALRSGAVLHSPTHLREADKSPQASWPCSPATTSPVTEQFPHGGLSSNGHLSGDDCVSRAYLRNGQLDHSVSLPHSWSDQMWPRQAAGASTHGAAESVYHPHHSVRSLSAVTPDRQRYPDLWVGSPAPETLSNLPPAKSTRRSRRLAADSSLTFTMSNPSRASSGHATPLSSSSRMRGLHTDEDASEAGSVAASVFSFGGISGMTASTAATSAMAPLTRQPRRTFPAHIRFDDVMHNLYRCFPVSSYLPENDPRRRRLDASHRIVLPPAPPDAQLNTPTHGDLDLYSPRYTKSSGSDKVGLCPICCEPEERGGEGELKWLRTKQSAFLYHMTFYHGISNANGAPFSPPVQIRVVPRHTSALNERSTMKEGLCHECNQWVAVQGIKDGDAKVAELWWWRHAKQCHHTRVDGEGDDYLQDALFDLLSAPSGNREGRQTSPASSSRAPSASRASRSRHGQGQESTRSSRSLRSTSRLPQSPEEF